LEGVKKRKKVARIRRRKILGRTTRQKYLPKVSDETNILEEGELCFNSS
jgi:hypothetical protein